LLSLRSCTKNVIALPYIVGKAEAVKSDLVLVAPFEVTTHKTRSLFLLLHGLMSAQWVLLDQRGWHFSVRLLRNMHHYGEAGREMFGI
jgi:hypothetical protein